MIAFIIRRLLQSILVMLAVALIAFSLFRYVGDPILAIVGQDTTPEERQQLREDLGLTDPVIVQFVRFAANVARGEFGISYGQRRPVIDMFIERLPATLELSLLSAVLALGIGIPMGVYSGLHPNNWLSRLFQSVSLVGISLPPFFVGILLIFFFSVMLGWLPSSGRGETVTIGWWSTGLLTVDGWLSLVLPAITLGLFQMTLIMRLVRSEMLEVLRMDYIKFARARGLKSRAVNFGHAFTETVFQWPGLGFLFLQSVTTVDIPVMAAYLVFVAAFFVIINLVVDLLYYAIDPRLRFDLAEASGNPAGA